MARDPVSKRMISVLDAIIAVLARSGLSQKFIRFAVVGTCGFIWDTSTVYALKAYTNLYIAGTCGFLVACTANWAMNRLWTFRDHDHAPAHIQWMKFLGANSVGFAVNRGTFFTLVSISSLCRDQPVLAIVAGSIAGLYLNYFLSKRLVFG